jgi:hypothetical protein
VCTTCVSASVTETKLCTCAGKLLKLDSLPMKPWTYTSSIRRRPVFSKLGSGISDCVDEDRGSCDDMAKADW